MIRVILVSVDRGLAPAVKPTRTLNSINDRKKQSKRREHALKQRKKNQQQVADSEAIDVAPTVQETELHVDIEQVAQSINETVDEHETLEPKASVSSSTPTESRLEKIRRKALERLEQFDRFIPFREAIKILNKLGFKLMNKNGGSHNAVINPEGERVSTLVTPHKGANGSKTRVSYVREILELSDDSDEELKSKKKKKAPTKNTSKIKPNKKGKGKNRNKKKRR